MRTVSATRANTESLDYRVSIPKADMKKFKGILKVMGWSFLPVEEPEYIEEEEILAGIDSALKEMKAGQGRDAYELLTEL